MTRPVPVGQVRLLGECAVLVGVEDAAAGRALARALHAAGDGRQGDGDRGGVRGVHRHGGVGRQRRGR